MEMERIGMIIKFLKFLLALCGAPVAAYDAVPPAVAPAPAPAPVAEPVQTSAQPHAAPVGQVVVPGKEVTLAGRVYIIAPLNAAAVKQYRDEIKAIFVGAMPDIELVSKLAHASLRRNYPSITVEAVEDILDYENYFEVWESLMNISGLVAQAKEMMRRVQDQMAVTG
jgi:hypothetical protein